MTPPVAELEWVIPPQQARSQKTMERLVAAAEELIVERGFEGATVAAIAQRASSSVGAFYARFPDKEAVLRVVLERFQQQAEATSDAVLSVERWRDDELADVLRGAATFMVSVFRERRHLIAAFTAQVARDPELLSLARSLGETIAERLWALIEQRDERARHPNPREAVRFAIWLILSALEARALHGDGEDVISDEAIATEATRMFLAYLGITTKDN